ncbi:rho GTPase-activating protein 7-like isoform X1 [Oncorhynchus clarkii lewisi]|uniref:rho GTPase-activating protein 7-like isoform X1 n=1 Tax=Oncorhynchus clarkii lewisi TaxID=490388 RepID=UPI0039B82219
MAHIGKTPLRRSFSEHVKVSTNKAWDVFWKSAREKRLWEIEAKEACDWLRAAGFPQYVQLYKDCRFPIAIDWVKSDHGFLDKDALDSLCRRLSTLNKCVELRLELGRSKRRGEGSEDEEPCAISTKWAYERQTRRWRRLEGMGFLHSPDSQGMSLCDANDHHEVYSLHSTSSTESEGCESPKTAIDDQETSGSSSRCSSINKIPSLDTSFSGPPSPGGETPSFSSAEERFLDKPPRKKGPSLLRKMEKLRLRGTSNLHSPTHSGLSRARLVISGPVLQDSLDVEHRLRRLQCLDISTLRHRDRDRPGSQASSSPSSPHSGSSSPSPSESSSTVSTPSPITRVRSNCRVREQHQGGLHRNLAREHQDYKNDRNNHESLVFQIPQGHKPGTFPTALTHNNFLLPIDNTSINWRTGSFHGYRGRRSRGCAVAKDKDSTCCSSLASLDHRVSIYDNVPIGQVIGQEMEHHGEAETGEISENDDVFSALDSVMERIIGLQQLVNTWTDKLLEDGESETKRHSTHSPCPSSSSNHIHLEVKEAEDLGPGAMEGEGEGDEENLEKESADGDDPEAQSPPCSIRQSQHHWSSEQSLPSVTPSGSGVEAQSVSQLHLLQKLSLLKLTALMDKYSPSSKQGWNWTFPKPPRKTKAPELKGRRVFGVPLLHGVQQTGEPLPSSILKAIIYLRTECLDQVGLFRKSGVKSRIQYLRDMVEADPEAMSYEGQSAFDVADMVKQYFRDLPEPVFSSKLCKSFLHIYQYFPKDQQFCAAQAAILLLPDENREALQTLLLFLRDVVGCVDENQMTPTNIAVCLAPSLFHLNTLKREDNTARSSHRKYSLGRPDQRDLSENLAATQGLAHMVTESLCLFKLPEFWPGQSVSNPSEEAVWVDVGRSSPSQGEEEEQDERARLVQTTQHLLREAREKSRGWESCSGPDNVDLAFKKVDDGWPLRLWKGSVEVDASQKEALQRVLREHGHWEKTLKQSAVVQTLTKDTEVYRYLLQGLGSRPPQEHLLLRTWQSDLSAGPAYVSAVSTEHREAPMEGVRAQVLSCLYLVEPLGAKKSRLTHLCRTDTRGRSQEWHNRVSGHLLASNLLAIRDSFRPDHR